jgi:RNA 3'-terminal phosphate cyclase (ATP)
LNKDALAEGRVWSGRNNCLDEFMRDQIVIFQALGKTMTTSENSLEEEKLSLHTRTAMWVCKEMIGRDNIDKII